MIKELKTQQVNLFTSMDQIENVEVFQGGTRYSIKLKGWDAQLIATLEDWMEFVEHFLPIIPQHEPMFFQYDGDDEWFQIIGWLRSPFTDRLIPMTALGEGDDGKIKQVDGSVVQYRMI